MAPSASRTGAKTTKAKPRSARRTWTRRSEARPDEILSSALDVFIRQGFDAARMEDIAQGAGVTKGALYLYFEGKEQLLRALIERELAPMVMRIEALADAGVADPAKTIRQLARLVSGVLANARIFALPLLVVAIANRFPDLAEDYRMNVFARGRAAMAGLIRRGIAMGQFRAVDAEAGARAIMGPLMFEVIWTHALKGPSELGRSQDWVDAQVDILLNGIAAEKAG